MSNRCRLPNRRLAETFDFEHEGLKYTATIGRDIDGRVAEIFLNAAKSSSAADVAVRDAAIACSFALQYGTPLETIRSALCRESDGMASGALGAAFDLIDKPRGDVTAYLQETGQ